MLDRFRTDEDRPAYERAYRALIAERDMPRIWREVAGAFQRPCLLCAEKTPERCHRRLLGEAVTGGEADRLVHL